MKNTNELIYDILLGEGPSSLTADQHEELKSSLTSALALMSKFDKGLRMVGADLITGREHFRYAGAKYTTRHTPSLSSIRRRWKSPGT